MLIATVKNSAKETIRGTAASYRAAFFWCQGRLPRMASLRAFALVLFGLGAVGCGGDDADDGGGSCGDTSACAATLAPSSDSTGMLQTKLIEAQSGDSICLCPGKYDLTKEMSLNVPNVTVKGMGKTREDVVLDFVNQTDGDDGMSVTSDGFTIENLAIANAKGNGIVVTG